MTVAKTEIYFATRKTASAHVYIAKGTGIVRVNNVPIEMMGAESARETVLAPLEIAGDLRDKVDISVRTLQQSLATFEASLDASTTMGLSFWQSRSLVGFFHRSLLALQASFGYNFSKWMNMVQFYVISPIPSYLASRPRLYALQFS